MMLWTIIKVSLKSLAANKLRSVLAMLGIIIGVWSVISALALAAGAQASVVKQISALGTNLLTITPGLRGSGGVNTGNQQNLRLPDAMAMIHLPDTDRVAPVVRGSVQVVYYNQNAHTTVVGVSPTYFTIRDFQVQYGRRLRDADADGYNRVCVLGSATAANLFGSDYAWAIGQNIQLNGVSYRVVGIMVSKGDQGWFNPDDQVIIPYTTAMKQVLGVRNLNEIDVSAKDQKSLPALLEQITRLLRKRHHTAPTAINDFNIFNQADLLRSASTINEVLSLLLGGIAGISLLVGGIGVMNIMLVTVTERTREIGIRKAIGAKQRDILRQFLIEAVVMSALGGLLGVAAGLVTSQVIGLFETKFELIIRPLSVILSLTFSAGVGIFFGFYPALRAAKLDPIEALRYE